MKALKKILSITVLSIISVLFACVACYYLLLCNIAGIPALLVYIATSVKVMTILDRRL